MAYLDNTPQSSGGITDGSDINANVFVANAITSNGAVNAVSITANTIAIVDGDYDITATNASPSQANGYAITKDFNVVTTSAGHGDAVTLPAPTIGRIITIINNGAKDVGVYPSANCAIDGLGTNGIYYLASGSSQRFLAKSATAWTRLVRTQRYVDRGNIASFDTESGWTRDNNYYEYSVAAIVPPSSAGKPVRFMLQVVHTGYVAFTIRTPGYNNARNFLNASWFTSGVSHTPVGDVLCDSRRVIEYTVTSNAGTQRLSVIGWWVEG
jgi:hypothetical protein